MTRTSLLLGLMLIAGDARAQLASPTPAELTGSAAPRTAHAAADAVSTFRSGVDLVALSVIVTDGQQKFVPGLDAANFAVFEDGVQQDVSFFAANRVPLDLALLLDTSASMTDKMQPLQTAAVEFVHTLGADDRAMIVDIKDATKILQPLTPDLAAATTAIRATQARGGTALYNGLYLTLKELVKARGGEQIRRQAIAVLTDGDDTASLVSFDDLMAEAKKSGIAIYTITLKSRYQVTQVSGSGHRFFSQSEFSMRALAQETGARSFFPTDISELSGVYASIADELANQYSLGYTSKNPRQDGAFRRVVIRITDHPGARPRTRSGYVAARAERRPSLQ